jgi:hypothetical protein
MAAVRPRASCWVTTARAALAASAPYRYTPTRTCNHTEGRVGVMDEGKLHNSRQFSPMACQIGIQVLRGCGQHNAWSGGAGGVTASTAPTATCRMITHLRGSGPVTHLMEEWERHPKCHVYVLGDQPRLQLGLCSDVATQPCPQDDAVADGVAATQQRIPATRRPPPSVVRLNQVQDHAWLAAGVHTGVLAHHGCPVCIHWCCVKRGPRFLTTWRGPSPPRHIILAS